MSADAAISTTLLKDVIDIRETVLTNDFVVKLSEGFADVASQINDYVVTEQIGKSLDSALSLVRTSCESNKSQAAYLHGSYGSGKSHFMTVLSAILTQHRALQRKVALQALSVKHESWIGRRNFLLVPYHLIGAASLDSAVLGGYVRHIAKLRPDAPVPAVYRDDQLLDDARRQRETIGDDTFIRLLTGSGGASGAAGASTASSPPSSSDDWDDDWKATPEAWTTASLDAAFAARPEDKARTRLVQALLTGPFKSYSAGMHGAADAFIPLENGLTVISQHARDLGYDCIVLFLDELILWLNTKIADQLFVQSEASKIVKLVESGDMHRAVPIVSFIARQRDLRDLIGRDAVGAEVAALEQAVDYKTGRIETIRLDDRNLPQIAQERVLKPKDAAAKAIVDAAFAALPSDRPEIWDTLLDPNGVTNADANAFRDLYPFSPAFLNTLVSLSGALQRERTGLKVLLELLSQRRETLMVGQLIPLGDLWDVLATSEVQAFSKQLSHEFDEARRFYTTKARPVLLAKNGVIEERIADLPHTHSFRRDDRLIKTLLLAYLAPDASALKRLDGKKIAALNQGAIRSMVRGQEATQVTQRLKELRGDLGEIRASDDENPVFHLELSTVDIQSILAAVEGKADSVAERRRYVRDVLLDEVKAAGDRNLPTQSKEIVWRGTRRTVGIVVGNVRDVGELADDIFEPGPGEDLRIVLDFPFDEAGHGPSEDVHRIGRLRERGRDGAVVCWLPAFFTDSIRTRLKELLGLRYLLGNPDRVAAAAPLLSTEDRAGASNYIRSQHGALESSFREYIQQAYGLSKAGGDVLDAKPDGGPLHPLDEAFRPQPFGGAAFERAFVRVATELLDHLYPHHPKFDPDNTGKAITTAELKIVLDAVSATIDMPGGRNDQIDKAHRTIMRRIANPLKLGEMLDGPFLLGRHWSDLVDRRVAGATDVRVWEIKDWLAEGDLQGAPKEVVNLVIAVYSLVANREWRRDGRGVSEPMPPLERVDSTWILRAQPLPTEEEFSAAVRRAQTLFGHGPGEVLNARTVKAFSDYLHERPAIRDERRRTLDDNASALVRLLEQHAPILDLDIASDAVPAGRLTTARSALDLLGALQEQAESTPLLRRFAGLELAAADEVVARSLSSAGSIRDALTAANWQALEALRPLSADETSAFGQQAGALLRALHDAAHADELSLRESLDAVLARTGSHAGALLIEVAQAHRAAAPQPPNPGPRPQAAPSAAAPAQPGTTNPQVPGAADLPAQQGLINQPTLVNAGQIPLVVDAHRPVTLDVGRTRRQRVRPGDDETLKRIVDEIRAALDERPGSAVEITWDYTDEADS